MSRHENALRMIWLALGAKRGKSEPPSSIAPTTETAPREAHVSAEGLGLGFLLARTSDWSHRRIEQVSFLDAQSARRRVTVAFTYPGAEGVVRRMIDAGGRAPVPLALLSKVEWRGPLEVSDETGRSLAVASRGESELAAGECLAAMAQRIVQKVDESMPNGVLDAMRAVAKLPSAEAAWLLGSLRRLADVHGSKPWEKTPWPELELLEPSESPAARQAFNEARAHAELMGILFDSVPLTTLARVLAGQVPLLVYMSCKVALDGERRLFSYEYDEPLRVPGGRTGTLRYGISALVGLSWLSADYKFEVPALGRASSYRIDVITPATAQVVRGELRAAVGPSNSVAVPRWKGGLRRLLAGARAGVVHTRHDRSRAPAPEALRFARRRLAGAGRPPCPPSRPNDVLWLDVGASDSQVSMEVDPAGPTPYQGLVIVKLQASRVGLIRTAPWLAVVTAVLLLIGERHLSQIEKSGGTGAAATVLLLIPTILAAVVARSGEHAMVTRLLRGVRLLVGLVGLGSFVAAVSLAGAMSVGTDELVWRVAAWMVAVTALLLFVSLAFSTGRMRSRRPAVALLR